MTTLEILTEVEAGRMSATEALELIEPPCPLIPGARYKATAYSGTFIKVEEDIAFFDMDKPNFYRYDPNGYVGFILDYAKKFEKI